MEQLAGDLRKLLASYAEPCVGDCDHSQCPLLRELHALQIKTTLKQARLTVKPIVDREKEGEQMGDLMNMQLHTPAPPAPDEADKALAQQIVSGLNWMDFQSLAPKQLVETIAAALAQARKETWEKAIRVAQLSAQKSEKASLDIAAAEILIRRLELAARDGREGKQERVNQDE